jgi:hypothetical protein
MRLRLLTIFTAVVAVAASLALTAAANSSTIAPRDGCQPPHIDGYHIFQLVEHGGIGCDHARHLLVEQIKQHLFHGYTCNHRTHNHYVHLHCTSVDNPAHQYTASFAVQ